MSATDAPNREIFIVDDDPTARELLATLFAQAGFRVVLFADGMSVVAAARARMPACIIVDLYMPGGSGLDLLNKLDARHCSAPIFVISGRSDIPCVVEAVKRGAFDFVEKHQMGETLVARVRAALDASARNQKANGAPAVALPAFPGSSSLTPREHEVLSHIVACASNKEAATRLGISRRTVEIHRAHIMRKLGAKNSVDLVRMVLGKSDDSGRRAVDDVIDESTFM
jgi:two-component system response regulator FixJ